MKPQNFEEKLVWYYIIATYGWYFLGVQYILGPALAWFLTLYLCKKLWNQTENTPPEEKITIPYATWIWIVSMLIMGFAVIMAHIDWDLGVTKLIGSTLTWARSWALMALFPLIGCLNIRPQLLYRAICILCLQSLAFILVCYLLYGLGLSDIEYLTPWWFIFRNDPRPYTVGLFDIDLDNFSQLRLNLFAPYANTLGLVGNVFFFLARQESDKKWRLIGMIGAAAMVVSSVSRMTTFCLVIVPVLTWILTNFTWPLQVAAGIVSLLTGMFTPLLIDFVETTWSQAINGYRASSKVVRDRLKQIALDSWKDAPIWGHGVTAQRGPKVTEFMPIGSHEQWSDLLFLKGIVGFTAFLVPLLWTFGALLIKAQESTTAKVGLSIFLLLLICTFAADIEAGAYLYWPGLVLTGIAFKEKASASINTNKKYVLP